MKREGPLDAGPAAAARAWATGPGRPPRLALLYHYMHPDDVVSARHFDDLGQGLAARGWEVTAYPSNRSCHDPARAYPLRDQLGPVRLRRVWRPAWRQARGAGRVANAAWLVGAWAGLGLLRGRRAPDAVVVGTDPLLAVAVAPVLRRLRGRSLAIAHWVFDAYPEAAVADGLLAPGGTTEAAARRVVGAGYRACDLVVDLGPCMRALLAAYDHGARAETIAPWALVEPAQPPRPDPETRRALFGEGARLGVLYAGNLGRAHDLTGLLAVARRLCADGLALCVAVREHAHAQVRAALGPDDTNVRLVGFCDEATLERRLAAADVHAVSLRPAWTGTVVPSKCFASLAIGRPLLFDGDPAATPGRLALEHDVGWVTCASAPARTEAAVAGLRALARGERSLDDLWGRSHALYRDRFARELALDRWDRALRDLAPCPTRGG